MTNMDQNIVHISLIVNDYDEAIDFYVGKLNFDLVEDTVLDNKKRWVLVSPKGNKSFSLLLAKATNVEQQSRV